MTTLNMGSMTGRGREFADMMRKSGLDVYVYKGRDGRAIRRGKLAMDRNFSIVVLINKGEMK